MKGLRRVIVPDALIAQLCTQGHRLDRPTVIDVGIPRGANLVGVERPAFRYGKPEIGSTAFIFEHESFDVVDPSGEVPVAVVIPREVVH